MKKRAIILSSISAIMLCVALAVGLTFSLLTGETSLNISVRSGVVQVNAEINDVKLYSAEADPDGELKDENGASYKEVERTGGKFLNGGTADVDQDGSIEFKNVSAGDKVSFKIDLENESNIPVMFNTLLTLSDQEENALFGALDIEVSAANKAENGEEGTTIARGTFGDEKSRRTGWVELAVGQSAVVNVTLALPVGLDGAALQGRAAKLKCVMSAIQFTGDLKDSVATIGKAMFMDMDSALVAAQNGDVIEVYNSDSKFTGKRVINKSVTITSADGILREMHDVQLEAGEGYSLALNGLKFTGNSSIDVTGASAFTMTNCAAEVAPEKLFDEGAQAFLPRAAFIASTGVRQSGTRFVLENNSFTLTDKSAEDTAAVYLAGAVLSGSYLKGNVFGGEGARAMAYDGYAVEFRSVGTAGGAEITVSGNEFYGGKGVKFAQDSSAFGFKAILSGNKMVTEGAATLALAEDGASVQLFDGGSTVNGAAITHENLQVGNKALFSAINVSFDANGLLLSGNIRLNVMTAEQFRTACVSPLADGGDITFVSKSSN